jgi:hypothetical protein
MKRGCWIRFFVQGKGLLGGVVSTGRCNTGFKFLCGGLVLQGLSGALVKLACDSAEFGLAKTRYISAFGKILAQKPVGVLIAATLPWRLRIAKVDLDLCRCCELAMPGHL